MASACPVPLLTELALLEEACNVAFMNNDFEEVWQQRQPLNDDEAQLFPNKELAMNDNRDDPLLSQTIVEDHANNRLGPGIIEDHDYFMPIEMNDVLNDKYTEMEDIVYHSDCSSNRDDCELTVSANSRGGKQKDWVGNTTSYDDKKNWVGNTTDDKKAVVVVKTEEMSDDMEDSEAAAIERDQISSASSEDESSRLREVSRGQWTSAAKKPKMNAWSKLKRRQRRRQQEEAVYQANDDQSNADNCGSSTAATKKLYQLEPLSNPDLERCRLNAINAKRNRDRKKAEAQQLRNDLLRLKRENHIVKQRLNAEKQRAMQAERALQRLQSLVEVNESLSAQTILKLVACRGRESHRDEEEVQSCPACIQGSR